MVDQSKVLFGVKKEGNQRDFFVVKGIIGQRYCGSDYWQSLRVDFPKSKPSLYNQKRKGKLLSIGRAAQLATAYWLLRVDLDSTWQHAHNRAFDEVFTCARAVCDSASTYLVVCRFNPSTYRGFAFCARLRWGGVRDRCESVRVGIQRSCVGIQRSCVRRKQ